MEYHRVLHRLSAVPQDHHFWGYETDNDFLSAVSRLHKRWKDKIGKQVGERHGFKLLRFYNRYGTYEDVWIPLFMLERVPPPIETPHNANDTIEEELDHIFGFD